MKQEQDGKPLEYPVFKGLQRPLEFMGFRGRYIVWAASTLGSAVLGFMLFFAVVGFLFAAIFAVVSLGIGSIFIFVYQHRGLHSKNREKGIFIVSRERNR